MDCKQKFIQTMVKFMSLVCKRVPDDVVNKLEEYREQEDTDLQKVIYDTYFENFKKAMELDRPCCQDTGLLHFYIKVGNKFPYLGDIKEWLNESVEIATKEIPLRPSAVNFFDEINTENGLGERIPWINWDIISNSDELEITTYFAGGGCSLPGKAMVFSPSQGYNAIAEFVYDIVTNLGINACPPVIIGVGLGENIENAAVLSKKAYLRPLGTHNPNPKGKKFEEILLNGVNSLQIGAQGLLGNKYALAVHVESSARHTGTIAAAVNIACYSHRRGIIKFNSNLDYTFDYYKGATL